MSSSLEARACVCVWAWTVVKLVKYTRELVIILTKIHPLIDPELTFAYFDALFPRVIKIGVAGRSTILVPSAAETATTWLAVHFRNAAMDAYSPGRSSASRRIVLLWTNTDTQ